MISPASHLQPSNGNDAIADLRWMKLAFKLALRAEREGEVPVGAVVVKDNKLIGLGYNQSIRCCDPSSHAEMNAIRRAGQYTQNYRLVGCTVYSTLEPCSMCAGAMVHARINTLVFATPDLKSGASGSILNVLQHPALNHEVNIRHGVLQAESQALLKSFFKKRREQTCML